MRPSNHFDEASENEIRNVSWIGRQKFKKGKIRTIKQTSGVLEQQNYTKKKSIIYLERVDIPLHRFK